MRALAPTLVHDLMLCNGGVVPRERLARIAAPTLAISGGDSPPWAARACADVAAVVPDVRTRVLAGQTHGAADDVLTPVLVDWFLS
jgi:pimeloyl-ACP methyl ester carboxylesterase